MSTDQIDLNGTNIIQLKIDGNAPLSPALTKQLDDALNRAEDLGATGGVLVHVTGNEGPDLQRSWPGDVSIQIVTKWERVLRRMERTSATTVVLAEKSCSFLGLDLLLVADRRVVGSNLRIELSCPHASAWPGMSLYRLTHQIGYARARKLISFSRTLTADVAMNFDIVDETVDEPYGCLVEAMNPLGQLTPDMPVRRRLLQDSLSTSFEDALGVHLAACDRALRNNQCRD
jgi:isomerase DpgB